MNDWTTEKTADFMNKTNAVGADLLNEARMLGMKILFTTTEQDRQDMLKRMKEIEQESIVLKKIAERVLAAHLEYLMLNGEES